MALPERAPGDGVEVLEEQLWLRTETEEIFAWSRPAGAPGALAANQAHKGGPFVASIPLFFGPGFDVKWRVLARTRDNLVVTFDLDLPAEALDALPAVATAKPLTPKKPKDPAYSKKLAAFQAQVLAEQKWLASLPEDERGEAYGKMKDAALGESGSVPLQPSEEVTP